MFGMNINEIDVTELNEILNEECIRLSLSKLDMKMQS